jgi:hypothetical protein
MKIRTDAVSRMLHEVGDWLTAVGESSCYYRSCAPEVGRGDTTDARAEGASAATSTSREGAVVTGTRAIAPAAGSGRAPRSGALPRPARVSG